MAESRAESGGASERRRSDRLDDDRPVGYYANEPDWASNSVDEAVDPEALMALFDARRKAGWP